MDLQVYFIIAVVFMVSFCSLLFINKQFRGGQTYEEALAEKRHLNEKLYGTGKNKKGPKKGNTGKKQAKAKKHHEKVSPSTVEVEAPTDSGSSEESSPPTTPGDNQKLHVEFTEAEIISATDENTTVLIKKQLSDKKKGAHQSSSRKNSSTKPPGSSILINKNDAIRTTTVTNNESLNHFEESQPKDDLEIRKAKEETTPQPGHKKEKKSAGKGKKDHSPRPVVTETVDAVVASIVETLPLAIASNGPKDSPKNAPNKSNKKKKTEAVAVQQKLERESDDINVSVLMSYLGRAELARSEIQILIDFLLNKQQDTINVDPSEWSDDILQKLRKQLEEKDRQLAEEQSAAVAQHNKFRELRAELNGERSRFNANAEELNALKLDLQQVQHEYQVALERTGGEKQALTAQLQQLQQKLFAEKNAQTQETVQKIQQLTDTNAQLTAEILTKNVAIQEMQEKFLQIRDESLAKLADYEKKFQDYDHLVRQGEGEVAHLQAENQRLRGECAHKDEYEKMFTIQKYDLEQLENRLAEQTKANHQLEESKVEIRNLQNALDSTKTELVVSRSEVGDSAKRVDELNSRLADLQKQHDSTASTTASQHSKEVEELHLTVANFKTLLSEKDTTLSEYQQKLESLSTSGPREDELFRQITDYKEKNNDLRKKNWKLVDALRSAEDNVLKHSSKQNNVVTPHTNNNDIVPILISEKNRTRQLFERLFPNAVKSVQSNGNHSTATESATDDYNEWLDNITKYIENHLNEIQKENHSNNAQASPALASKSHLSNNLTNSLNNNHHHDDDGDDDGDGDDVSRTDGAKQSTSNSSSTEELILQNAKLKTTVDEYKSIVAETESLLTNLEKKVKEQDDYWRTVVDRKDSEIKQLQTTSVSS